MSAVTDTSFIEDLPSGPLDHYRKQAKFDWKKLKLVFEDADDLKTKVWSGTTWGTNVKIASLVS